MNRLEISEETVRAILSLASVVILLILLIVLTFVEIPKDNIQMLNVAVGGFLGFVAAVYAFYFGSSSGSKAKTKMLDDELSQDDLQTSNTPAKL